MRACCQGILLNLIVLLWCYNAMAQLPDSSRIETVKKPATVFSYSSCQGISSTFLLNADKEKDEWQIIAGPAIKGVTYPVQPAYIPPFSSWEMDRYSGDSSWFINCDWMVLPDKKKVINTVSRIPLVYTKRFSTTAASKVNLFVKILYDNMAYLYIDSMRVPLNHNNPDINRFIKEISPELSSFVSIPSTFNYSHNASFYAGNLNNLVLPAGDHIIKIELFNNANEMGCIIKGMLISGNDEKIFCADSTGDETAARINTLTHHNQKVFIKSKLADSLYGTLMQTIKTANWINSLLRPDHDFISNDTLRLKKGEKINCTPLYITSFRNGATDTTIATGTFRKLMPANSPIKKWERSFVFDAAVKGLYILEINCSSPSTTDRTKAFQQQHYTRIIKVQ